jgi:hypothetical protein
MKQEHYRTSDSENIRHNQAVELESIRSNVAKERENVRHNTQVEAIQRTTNEINQMNANTNFLNSGYKSQELQLNRQKLQEQKRVNDANIQLLATEMNLNVGKTVNAYADSIAKAGKSLSSVVKIVTQVLK